MTSLKHDLKRIYEELHKDFPKYINYNKLRKEMKIHFKTAKEYVFLLNELGLFNKPICEWHDEDWEELKKEIEENK